MTTDGAVPPNDLEAEASVLSAAMLDPSALGRVSDILRPEMFYAESHRRIFEAILQVRESGSAIDSMTVASRLRDTNRLNQVGGTGYIVEILDVSPHPQHVRDHAVSVHERWRAREILRICHKAVAEGYGAIPDAQKYASDVAEAAIEIARKHPGKVVEDNIETLKRIIRDIVTASSGAKGDVERGMPTGIPSLDGLTLGMHAGHKFTIAALPRIGKTTLGLQLALRVAKSGIGATVFSTEMSRDELAERQLAHLARVDYQRIRRARAGTPLSREEMERIGDAIQDLKTSNLHMEIHDDVDVSVEDIAARARLHKERLALKGIPLGVIVVDYVQRLKPSLRFAKSPNANKYEVVSHSTKALKNIAKDLGVCVIELAQQKVLQVDKKTGQRPHPRLGDVAECSQIERESDEVLYLWRPNEKDGSTVTASLVKQRAGETGDIDLTLKGEYSTFEERY